MTAFRNQFSRHSVASCYELGVQSDVAISVKPNAMESEIVALVIAGSTVVWCGADSSTRGVGAVTKGHAPKR